MPLLGQISVRSCSDEINDAAHCVVARGKRQGICTNPRPKVSEILCKKIMLARQCGCSEQGLSRLIDATSARKQRRRYWVNARAEAREVLFVFRKKVIIGPVWACASVISSRASMELVSRVTVGKY